MRNFYLAILFLMASVVAHAQVEATFGKGIKFTAPDNSFSLKFGLRIQPLFTTNFRDFEKLDNPELNDYQMLIRRARLKFDGHVYDPRLTYKFELAFGNRNIGGISEYTNFGARVILDAVIKYQFHKNFSIWFGQTKLPGNRERVVSSQKLQFVDRNIINSRYNLDRDMGFQLHGKHMLGNMPVKTAFAFSMGEGRNITELNLGGFEYTFRAEILPFGKFSSKKGEYSEADLFREPKPKLAIGATFDYNDRAVRSRGNQGKFMIPDGNVVTNSLTTFWIDAILKYKGWSTQVEFGKRNSSSNNLVFREDATLFGTYYTGYGINVQTGYVFKNNFEVAGRVSLLRPEQNVTNQTNQYTLVLSKYIVGHSLKIQTDISYTHFEIFNGDFKEDPLMFRFQVEIAL